MISDPRLKSYCIRIKTALLPFPTFLSSIHLGDLCVAAIGYLQNVGQANYTRLHQFTSPQHGALHLQDACHTTGGRPSEGRAAAAERVHTERAKISKPRLREIVRIFSQPLERICTEFHHIRGSIFFSFWRLSASGAAYQNKVSNCRLTEVPY